MTDVTRHRRGGDPRRPAGRRRLAARPSFSPVDTPKVRFIKVWDAHSGRELLAVLSASCQDRVWSNYPHIVAFTSDGHRLLEYVVKHEDVVGISRKDYIEVATWDATPREEANRP